MYLLLTHLSAFINILMVLFIGSIILDLWLIIIIIKKLRRLKE